MPVDFEVGDAWWERLIASGFDSGQPAIVALTGVSMYLTKNAIAATLRQVAALASGSVLVMSFLLPIESDQLRVVPARTDNEIIANVHKGLDTVIPLRRD